MPKLLMWLPAYAKFEDQSSGHAKMPRTISDAAGFPKIHHRGGRRLCLGPNGFERRYGFSARASCAHCGWLLQAL
jgi:hypothetical protein